MFRGKIACLRPFEWEDAEAYRRWVNDSDIIPLVDRVRPVTAGEQRVWYESISRDPRVVIFAVDAIAEHRFVGCVWLYAIDARHRHAELRVLIGDKDYWGSGVGTEAIAMLVHFAFAKLNLNKLYAYVLAANARALKTFERIGFVREGLLKKDRYVNGKFVDVVRFGLLRRR
jgi:RimJ/RimL family protein N-acetyltransferase